MNILPVSINQTGNAVTIKSLSPGTLNFNLPPELKGKITGSITASGKVSLVTTDDIVLTFAVPPGMLFKESNTLKGLKISYLMAKKILFFVFKIPVTLWMNILPKFTYGVAVDKDASSTIPQVDS